MTRPETNRLAYYSFLARRALRQKETEIGRDVIVEYENMKFLIPKGHREAFYSLYMDESEPLTYQLMSNLKGEVFVDVGANVGGYTVRLGRRFQRVISIEPNPRAADFLRQNIELNHLSNVRLVHDAISDTVGEATMTVPSSGKTTRSSIVKKYEQGSSFTVPTSTLDTLLQEYDKIDLIKIDVEGAEARVLKGAEKTIQRTSKIVLELDPLSQQVVYEILDKHGFEISDLDVRTTGDEIRSKNIAAVHY
jgi:FkbM family methyltransferase